jgi:hypothetical protein
MIKDNGLDPRDPNYDDYGFSDFEADYEPTEDQLTDWLTDRPEEALEIIKLPGAIDKYSELLTRWTKDNQETIEEEWNSKGEE